MTATAQRKGPNLANALKYHDARKDLPLYTMEDARRDLEDKRAQDVEDYKQSDHYADVRAVTENARKFSGNESLTPEELSDRMIKACENMAALKSYDDVDQSVLGALETSSISQIIRFLMHFPVPFMELSELAYHYCNLALTESPWELFYCVKHLTSPSNDLVAKVLPVVAPKNPERLAERINAEIARILDIRRTSKRDDAVYLFLCMNRARDHVVFLHHSGIDIRDAAMLAQAYNEVTGEDDIPLGFIDRTAGGLFKNGEPVSDDAEELLKRNREFRKKVEAGAKSVNH